MKPIIIITGPTGSGKTDFSLEVARAVSGEIINADMGQMFSPLTIGTAKPAWRQESIPHHLFDNITEPEAYSAASYRKDVQALVDEIESRGHIPVIVGGSGFYLQALLWRFKESPILETTVTDYNDVETSALWEILKDKDPMRANEIHENDRYRITRALKMLDHGMLPSSHKPEFDPIRPFIIINVVRSTDDLDARILSRLDAMLQSGWVEEVQELNDAWKSFVYEKKIIGYNTIIDYLNKKIHFAEMKELIFFATKHYAKRQRTFWRGLKRKIQESLDSHPQSHGQIYEYDLTLSDHTLYINQLIDRFNAWNYNE